MSDLRACDVKRFEITKASLPLSCPLPEFRLWDAHPRIYLPIKATGQAVCPYCGTQYILLDFKAEDAETDVEVQM